MIEMNEEKYFFRPIKNVFKLFGYLFLGLVFFLVLIAFYSQLKIIYEDYSLDRNSGVEIQGQFSPSGRTRVFTWRYKYEEYGEIKNSAATSVWLEDKAGGYKKRVLLMAHTDFEIKWIRDDLLRICYDSGFVSRKENIFNVRYWFKNIPDNRINIEVKKLDKLNDCGRLI